MSGKSTITDIESSLKQVEYLILNSKYDQAFEECSRLQNHCQSDQERIKVMFSLARINLGNRKFLEALEVIKTIPQAEIIAEIWMLKSQTEMYLGMHLESLSSANKALELKPDLIGAYVFKSQALKHLYRDNEASETLEQGLDYLRKIHGVREIKYDLEKAFLARACQQYDHGIKYARYVVEEAPNYATGYLHLGINLLLKYINTEGIVSKSSSSNLAKKTAIYDEAIKALDKALELNPNDSVAVYYKGLAYESVGEVDTALNLYHMASDLSKGYANAVLALVNIHMQKDEDDTAITFIDDLVSMNPSEEALFAQLKAYGSADRFEEAELVVDRLITINPENHYYYYRKALLESSQKKYEDSIRSCDKALALKGPDADILYQKALAYASMHDFNRSLEMIEQVLAIKPDYAMAHQAMGYVLGEIASRSSSETFKILALKGSLEWVHPDVIELIQRGEIEDAEIWYYNNINRSNQKSLELVEAVDKLINANEYERASHFLIEAIRINPAFPLAIYKIIHLYQNLLFRPDLAEPYYKMLEEYEPYKQHLEEGKKLPHILAMEEMALQYHNKAIELDPTNPMLHSSKASTLGKFHRLAEMMEEADDATDLLSMDSSIALAPEQIEYIKHQNEKRVDLLKEIKKLVTIANSIHMNMDGSSFNVTGFSEQEVTEREILSPTSEIEPSIVFGMPVSKKVVSLSEMRNLPSIRRFEGLSEISEENVSSAFPMASDEAETSRDSPIARDNLASGTMNSLSGEFGLRNVISHTRISSLASHLSSHGGDDLAHSLAQRNFMDLTLNSQSSQGTKHQIHTVQIRNLVHNSPLPPTSRQSSGESTVVPDTPQTEMVSETSKVETVLEVMENTHKKNMSIGALAKASLAVKSSLNMAARKDATIKEMQDQLKFLREAILEAQKHLVESEQRNNALAGEVGHLRDDLSYAIAHDKELGRYEAEQNTINNEITGSLSQYQMGFVRSIQKFIIGALSRTSGMVGDKNYSIPGLEYIPLPPIADEIVKAVQMAGSFALQVRDDNQITNFLNSLGNPMEFAQDVAPKIAARIAIAKSEEITTATREERHGIFKIVNVYDKLKNFIWENENPTYAAQLGAEDAIKIIASFKHGNINLNRKNTAEAIDDVFVNFMGHKFIFSQSSLETIKNITQTSGAVPIFETKASHAALHVDTKQHGDSNVFEQENTMATSKATPLHRTNTQVSVSLTDSGHLILGGVGMGANHSIHLVVTPAARVGRMRDDSTSDEINRKISMSVMGESEFQEQDQHPIRTWFKNVFCCCTHPQVSSGNNGGFVHHGNAFQKEVILKPRTSDVSESVRVAESASGTPDSFAALGHSNSILGDLNIEFD